MGIAQLEKVKVDMRHWNPKRGYFYRINLSFFYWAKKDEVEKILLKIRAGEFKDFIGELEQAVSSETDRQPIDMRSEFILSQLTHALLLIEEKKIGEAQILFDMVEKILPEYKDSPRWNEIMETRSVVWDMLEKSK